MGLTELGQRGTASGDHNILDEVSQDAELVEKEEQYYSQRGICWPIATQAAPRLLWWDYRFLIGSEYGVQNSGTS